MMTIDFYLLDLYNELNFFFNFTKMSTRDLLKHMVDYQVYSDVYKNILDEFEARIVYKECFANAHNLRLSHLSSTCDMTLLAIVDDVCVGCIQAIDPILLDWGQLFPTPNSTVIINFCVNKRFRSLGIGTSLLQTMLRKLENKTICIAINKLEPLNDAQKLQANYRKHGFQLVNETPIFILMQKS